MHSQCIIWLAMAALGLSVSGVQFAGAKEPTKPDDAKKSPLAATAAQRTPAQAIERGLAFLEKDALKWRKDRGCATCHHGTLTVWALSEAKAHGYSVGTEAFAEIMEWTKEQMVPHTPTVRDPRRGWRLVGVPAIYLGVMSQNLTVLSRDELKKFAVHLARHQDEDGSFELPLPAESASPSIWESSETLALWALLAWEPSVFADPKEAQSNRASREKTVAWLSKAKPTNTTQSNALRLLLDVRTGNPAEQIQQRIDQLLKLQKEDGGWSQTKDLASDAFATGQALYALSFAGVKNDRPEIQRSIAFLTSTQRDDGSWPMTHRNHPEVDATNKPVKGSVPITYFGSAWAMLGLVRYVPSPPDTPAKRQRAFDDIKGYHGTYEVDKERPDHPVVRVDLRYYEKMDDAAVENFTKILQAFPRLAQLQFKSPKITDAGLAHLKNLPQLRSVSLENAAITDAGLAHLKVLPLLEALSLKGTKVTDAGVKELKLARPELQISR